jgi:predicted nucleic acid-binding protein
MATFVDTSALYAVLDRDDANHTAAATAWKRLLTSNEALVVTNYVLVEACALIQHRLGLDALRAFATDVVPVLDVHWLSPEEHSAALQAVLTANRRRLSLVDCASFACLRTRGLDRAFAFDAHFEEQGFRSP